MPAPRSSVASATMVVVAAVVLPLALVSGWLATIVTDTDQYVDTVAPLAENPTVRAAVEVRLESALLDAIDFDRRQQQIAALLEDRDLPPRVRLGLRALAGPLEGALANAVHNAVVRVVQDPEFASAWAQANRSAHEQLVAVLSGQDTGLISGDGRVSIQLSTLINSVLGILGEQGVVDPANLPEVQASFTFMEVGDLTKAERAYSVLAKLGLWLPAVWLLLVALAVVLARNRRAAVRLLSYGALVGVVLLAIVLRIGRNHVIGVVPDDTDLVREVWDILLVSLRASMRTLLILALLALGIAWLSGPAKAAVRLRELAGSPTNPLTARAVVAPLTLGIGLVAVLVVLIWVV